MTACGGRCRDVSDCRPTDPDPLLARAVVELAREFDGTFDVHVVHDVVGGAYRELAAGAAIRHHLPVLATRRARAILAEHRHQLRNPMTAKPEVLFVCVHNAGRSQMAAALLQHYALGRVAVRSAGSAPADRVNPAAAQALAELGIDITAEVPSKLSTEDVSAADVVITMGCGDSCPVFPGKRYLDWDLADPAGQSVAAVRTIRDDIDRRVRGLLSELLDADRDGAGT